MDHSARPERGGVPKVRGLRRSLPFCRASVARFLPVEWADRIGTDWGLRTFSRENPREIRGFEKSSQNFGIVVRHVPLTPFVWKPGNRWKAHVRFLVVTSSSGCSSAGSEAGSYLCGYIPGERLRFRSTTPKKMSSKTSPRGWFFHALRFFPLPSDCPACLHSSRVK